MCPCNADVAAHTEDTKNIEKIEMPVWKSPKVAGSSPAPATKNLIKPYRHTACEVLFFIFYPKISGFDSHLTVTDTENMEKMEK